LSNSPRTLILPTAGSYLLFKKAGQPAWKGLIPVYNSFVMLQSANAYLLVFSPVHSGHGWFITLGSISSL